MIFNLLLPFLSAAYFEGVFPELSAFGLYGASVEMTASIFFSKFGKRRIVSVIQAFYLYVIRLLFLRTHR